MTAVGFDTDNSYMLVEVAGDVMHFQTLSRTGRRVDSGSLTRQPPRPDPTVMRTPAHCIVPGGTAPLSVALAQTPDSQQLPPLPTGQEEASATAR